MGSATKIVLMLKLQSRVMADVNVRVLDSVMVLSLVNSGKLFESHLIKARQ